MSLLGSALLLQEISQALGEVHAAMTFAPDNKELGGSTVSLSVWIRQRAFQKTFRLEEITGATYPSVLADQFISQAREVLNDCSS